MIHHDLKKNLITMNFPIFVYPSDNDIESNIVTGIFDHKNITNSTFADLWHEELRDELLKIVYHKYPKCDKNVYNKVTSISTDRQNIDKAFNFNDWKPFKYPIFNITSKLAIHLVYATFGSINKDLKMNAMRCMFNINDNLDKNNLLKYTNNGSFKSVDLRKQLDMLEGLYFKNIIPKKFVINVNEIKMTINCDDLYKSSSNTYIPLGMIYVKSPWNTIRIEFDNIHLINKTIVYFWLVATKRKSKFNIINKDIIRLIVKKLHKTTNNFEFGLIGWIFDTELNQNSYKLDFVQKTKDMRHSWLYHGGSISLNSTTLN